MSVPMPLALAAKDANHNPLTPSPKDHLQSNSHHVSETATTGSQSDASTQDNLVARKCPSVDDIEHLIDSQTQKMDAAIQQRNNGNCNNNNVGPMNNSANSGSSLEMELAAKEKEVSVFIFNRITSNFSL